MSKVSFDDETIGTLLDFLKLTENLKTEMRHSWLSNGRQESVAEHCFQKKAVQSCMICGKSMKKEKP